MSSITMPESSAGMPPVRTRFRSFFAREPKNDDISSDALSEDKIPATKWSMGILNDRKTDEVPGSVLLLTGHRNEPLGLRQAPARTSASSLPTNYPPTPSPHAAWEHKKKTKDGAIILEPQPDESRNDPLNWPEWRRDAALISLGFYCMIGGGMTPVLAAGFTNVAETYDVSVPRVALTTGLYMMGLGIGSVFASPTAILYGKRPVYLAGSILFAVTSIWCAVSPSYISLLLARIVMGLAVSPVECLPSATIAEIFFLHERAYRIGIYTLLLLGGKNLIPLVSASIIQSLGWRWVFWIVAITVGFCFGLLFVFVPETFWDRTPRPKSRNQSKRAAGGVLSRMLSSISHRSTNLQKQGDAANDDLGDLRRQVTGTSVKSGSIGRRPSIQQPRRPLHVGFAPDDIELDHEHSARGDSVNDTLRPASSTPVGQGVASPSSDFSVVTYLGKPVNNVSRKPTGLPKFDNMVEPIGLAPPTPALHNFNSPFYVGLERSDSDYIEGGDGSRMSETLPKTTPDSQDSPHHSKFSAVDNSSIHSQPLAYTHYLQGAPPRSFLQQLKPYNGRLTHDSWFRVAVRPFFLFAYPAVLWSSIVYACSIGWLIVLSEAVASIYRNPDTYNFSALSTGLVYLSPFIGGILGTAVAGKVSDIIVRAMSKRNGGLYEPEFRLVMAAPVAITTVIGLMGFGWSTEEHDAWIVPTIFFGIISFGCSLGSTTAITFCVDSYRQYAGEALVTLNFSKNIFHGLVFSLFFNSWLEKDGTKKVFVALGGIQLALMLLTVPMYIYGKRARMWTVRKNFMEKF